MISAHDIPCPSLTVTPMSCLDFQFRFYLNVHIDYFGTLFSFEWVSSVLSPICWRLLGGRQVLREVVASCHLLLVVHTPDSVLIPMTPWQCLSWRHQPVSKSKPSCCLIHQGSLLQGCCLPRMSIALHLRILGAGKHGRHVSHFPVFGTQCLTHRTKGGKV